MKNSFQFNRSQKAAVITLAIIIFVLIYLLNRTTHQFIPDILVPDDESAKYDTLQLHNEEDTLIGFSNKKAFKINYFDPNYTTAKDWQKMGFSSKQAQSIIKYKHAINGFKNKADLEACYVISTQKFKEIKPFILFRSKTEIAEKSDSSKVEKKLILLELNKASKKELVEVSGIGDVLANRILSYRASVGGFHDMLQLKEVYGLSDENFERMKSELCIDTNEIVKIDVQHANFNQLHKHPYINWNMAKKIMLWSASHAETNLIQFLENDSSILQNEILQLKPYLP